MLFCSALQLLAQQACSLFYHLNLPGGIQCFAAEAQLNFSVTVLSLPIARSPLTTGWVEAIFWWMSCPRTLQKWRAAAVGLEPTKCGLQESRHRAHTTRPSLPLQSDFFKVQWSIFGDNNSKTDGSFKFSSFSTYPNVWVTNSGE